MKRKIVKIDGNKCDGCGLCIPQCAEGAIRIIDGKARLAAEKYCDGLGACLGHCPRGAITIEEREVEEFDEAAVKEHLRRLEEEKARPAGSQDSSAPGSGCPSARMMDRRREAEGKGEAVKGTDSKSRLSQWPIQLSLVPPQAPYLRDAELLLSADCVPFAYPDFHEELLRGKIILIGCPKLDDAGFYREKLTRILQGNDIKDITVAHMEVPCCFGLNHIVREAVKAAGKDIPVREITIGIKGNKQEK